MKLKNVGALFTGALLAASLVACGGSQNSQSTGSSSDSSNGAAKTYTIATDTAFAPFEFADATNTYKGIDVDILAAIAKDQGFEYTLNPVGFDAALQNVQAGQADGVIAGMSITDQRKQTFDFSDPYYDSTVCCAVAANSDVKSLDDLKGKNVAVKNGTQSQAWAESIKAQYGFNPTTFDSSDMMYNDVEAGNSVACFEDTPVMSYAISQYEETSGKEGKNFKIVAEVEADSEFATPYGFAVNKGANAELLKKFNDGLANIKKDGTYDKIVSTYVKAAK
ncbi:MAG: transporter substrate-binding domain-containing protein [Atopobiaceae bacterium]|nr:transporter substrate-binding domain-containing protein [Atopobiaceae bacterium]